MQRHSIFVGGVNPPDVTMVGGVPLGSDLVGGVPVGGGSPGRRRRPEARTEEVAAEGGRSSEPDWGEGTSKLDQGEG